MHPTAWADTLLHQLHLGIACACDSTANRVLLLGVLLFHHFFGVLLFHPFLGPSA